MTEYDRVSTLHAFGVTPLDPEPYAEIEAEIRHVNGVTFQRATGRRATSRLPGYQFFPRHGYEMDEIRYRRSSEADEPDYRNYIETDHVDQARETVESQMKQLVTQLHTRRRDEELRRALYAMYVAGLSAGMRSAHGDAV